MKSDHPAATKPAGDRVARLFAMLMGGFLGLTLVKFGNPVVLEKLVAWPDGGWEWFFNPWPVTVSLWVLGLISMLGIFTARWKVDVPGWLVALPVIWLGWQFVSATHTVDAELTRVTLRHFVVCVVCFFLGLFSLGHTRNPQTFLMGLVGGWLVVIAVGWQQHFGGLEETRRYFFAYIYPTMDSVPAEYLKKMFSDRIFSTLFYPNALAGVLLLLSPVAGVVIWRRLSRLTMAARGVLVGLLCLAALGCLLWSGSKGGLLLALLLGLTALLRLPFRRQWKLALVAGVLVAGLAVFAVRFAGYFQKGATSVSARMDYWEAATRTAATHPIFGTGPGTFAIPYKHLKRPESEMSRLVHNDYLEQASDSGVVGFLSYAGFVAGVLCVAYRKIAPQADGLKFAVWLGLLGWSLQGLMEFGLYIPALAWTAFGLMGWLLANANQFDNDRANQ